MYRHKLILLKNTYLQEIFTLNQQIAMPPKESFFICKNVSYCKWIQTLNGKQVTIPKKNRKLAEKLAYRKYALLRIYDLTQEIKSIDKYLKSPPLGDGKSTSLLKNPLYTELLSPYFQSLDQELSKLNTFFHNWMYLSFFLSYVHLESYFLILTHLLVVKYFYFLKTTIIHYFFGCFHYFSIFYDHFYPFSF